MMNFLTTKAAKILLITAISICLFSVAAFASTISLGVGKVTASALNMRSSASTSATRIGSIPNGANVVVLSSENGWSFVNYNGTECYVSSEYITLSKSADVSIGTGLITADSVAVRADATPESDTVTVLKKSATAPISGIKDGWYKITVDGKTGYVRSDMMSVTKATTSSRGETAAATSTTSATGDAIAAAAAKCLGVRYKYGGTTTSGFDCSGFTMYVYKQFGFSLPHTATGQMGYGTSVAKSNLSVGDLVFFRDTKITSKAASHVGIYVGNNKFIHASSSGTVRYSSLSETYFAKYYVGARHLIK